MTDQLADTIATEFRYRWDTFPVESQPRLERAGWEILGPHHRKDARQESRSRPGPHIRARRRVASWLTEPDDPFTRA